MAVTSQRTQIILPKTLREEIENQRKLTGESLAEYLRKAAEDRIKKEKKRKVDLKRLAEEVVGVAAGSRSKTEIAKWEREIRETRRLEDKHWVKLK